MKKILIFFITTISGFYIGSGVSITLNNIFPKFFAVDPNFIQKVFSNKPTITSEILGYLIYATTAFVMYILSNFLNEYFLKKEKNYVIEDE
tara:strand:- start:105 stop:377 length:273 start_codon:yes stop_codon:yes gene_type:complete